MGFQDSWWNISTSSLPILAAAVYEISRGKTDTQDSGVNHHRSNSRTRQVLLTYLLSPHSSVAMKNSQIIIVNVSWSMIITFQSTFVQLSMYNNPSVNLAMGVAYVDRRTNGRARVGRQVRAQSDMTTPACIKTHLY